MFLVGLQIQTSILAGLQIQTQVLRHAISSRPTPRCAVPNLFILRCAIACQHGSRRARGRCHRRFRTARLFLPCVWLQTAALRCPQSLVVVREAGSQRLLYTAVSVCTPSHSVRASCRADVCPFVKTKSQGSKSAFAERSYLICTDLPDPR